MTSGDEIRKRQANRFLFLRRLYEISGGSKFAPANFEEIGKEIGIASDEAQNIVDYLSGKHLVKWNDLGGGVCITEWGVDEVEAALRDPDAPTTDFPPVNIMMIGSVSHSQIQQGTLGGSQSMTIGGRDRDEIVRVLKAVKAIMDRLPTSQRKDVDADIATVEAQLRASKPKPGIIREALQSMKEAMEPFADAAAVAEALVRLSTVLAGLA